MKKYSLLLVSSLVLVLSSCLKDKDVEDGLYGMQGADKARLAEIASESGSNFKSFAFDFADKVLDVAVVEVRLTSNDLPKQPVTVTLSLANSAAMISDYNAEHGSSFVMMPANLYTITTGLDVTIPAGERVGYLYIKTNTINYDPSTSYALGFHIASVSDASYLISGNMGKIVTSFGAKNKYDGRYRATGTCVDASGIYHGFYPTEIDLETVSGTAVKYYQYEIDYPNYIVENITTGGLANSGVRPIFNFDNTTNQLVSLTNANNGAAVPYTPGGNYNPSSKTITVQWVWGGGRFLVTETYTYIGPR